MKKLICVIIVFAFCLEINYAQTSYWQQVSSISGHYFRIVKTNNNHFLVASQANAALYESINLINWNPLPVTFPSAVFLAFNKDNFGKLFISTDVNGIYSSTNNGLNWSYANVGAGFGCASLDIDKDSLNYIYVGVGGYLRGIYVSTDNGFNWTNKLSGLDFTDIEAINSVNKIYASNTNFQIWYSSNHGANWSQITGQPFSGNTIMIKHIGSTIFVFAKNGNIYKSTDEGSSWSLHSNIQIPGTGTAYCNDAVFPNSNTWWVGIAQNGVWRSQDNGLTWLRKDSSLAGDFHYLFKEENTIIATTSIGIFKYEDGLAAPILISPSNNSIGVSVTPALIWNTVTGATGYKVKISSDSTFTVVTDSATVSSNQYTVPSGKLIYNTKYYWKVSGYNTNGNGPWSNIWNFTTLNPLPAQVTLISPANNSTGLSLTPTLFWNTATNATAYKVEVSPINNFSLIVDSVTVTTNQRTIPAGKLNIATTYFWRVRGVNSIGNGPWSTVWNFSTILTEIHQLGSEIPKEYKLYDNYPNPFNPSTTIKYDVPAKNMVELRVYDITGSLVTDLVNQELEAGRYEVTWNASGLSSGIYFYVMKSADYREVKRTIMLK